MLMGPSLLPGTLPQGLAAAAALVSAVNVAGGFTMTHRMLAMFRRPGDPSEHTHLYAIPAAAIPAAYIGAVAMGE
jgi:H+-translocating NAD(P) transhydrogenase